MSGELLCQNVFMVEDVVNRKLIGLAPTRELADKELCDKRTSLLIRASVFQGDACTREEGVHIQSAALALRVVEVTLSHITAPAPQQDELDG